MLAQRAGLWLGLRQLLNYAEAFTATYDIDDSHNFGEKLQEIITDVNAAFPRLKRGTYAYHIILQLTGRAISLCKDAAGVHLMSGEYRRDVMFLSNDDEKYLPDHISHIIHVTVAPVSSEAQEKRLEIIERKIIMVAVVASLIYNATK